MSEVPLLHQSVGKLSGLIPYRLGLLIYRFPVVASLLRRFLSHFAENKLVVVDICGGLLEGHRIEVNLKSEKYYWLGTYEPELQEIVSQVVRPGQVVYDVGAHVGFFTLAFAHLVERRGLVVAFEPVPENVARLKHNILLNSIEHVRVEECAVSDTCGSTPIMWTERTSMASIIEKRWANIGGIGKREVKTITLDGFVKQNPAPNVEKIDVEGAEAHVLRGMAETLRNHKPIIILEIHGKEQGVSVLRTLDECGYELLSADNYRTVIQSFSDTEAKHFVAVPGTAAALAPNQSPNRSSPILR